MVSISPIEDLYHPIIHYFLYIHVYAIFFIIQLYN